MEPVITLLTLVLGPWMIVYDEASQLLKLDNTKRQISVTGKFSFENEDGVWQIAPPRDGVRDRMALVNPWGAVQGYITFRQNGERLAFMVQHRTRQFYSGKLIFDGQIRFRRESFACQTVPTPGSRVLFLGSGPADSSYCDTLFAPEEDLALQVTGGTEIRLTDLGNGLFGIRAVCDIEKAEEASIFLNPEPDYYKSRYIPYYQPLDRKRCPVAPTGWMSWNVYFDTATAEDNLAEARLGKEYFQPFGMEFWSIESWQKNSDRLPVSKFYNLNLEPNEEQFPEGMKKLADDIRNLGFRPGLWTVPYGTGDADFYETHKDWFLHDTEGKPVSTWAGRYTIDPTVPEAVENIRRIHEVAAREWGYEFFKVDGMSGGGPAYMAHLYEEPEIRARFRDPYCSNPFEKTVAAIRKGIGPNSVFLACQGHYTGPEAAYADAARIGADIVDCNQPVKWENVRNQGGRTLNQIFVNNIAFYTDPDTLLVGDLDMEQARVSAVIVSLPGQVMFNGDRLARLSEDKIALVQQTLPPADVHPMNLYPFFDYLPIWNLRIVRPFGAWNTTALFNWDDEAKEISFSFEELGLDPKSEYCLYEFWTGQFFGAVSGSFSMEVPARAVRLICITPADPKQPRFLSSSRHIAQGAVDLTGLEWDDAARTLTGKVRLVGGHKTVLRFTLPADLVPADGPTPPVIGGYRLWEKELETEKSGESAFIQRFIDNDSSGQPE